MINAFKFFFEKVHNSEISDQSFIRPRKGFYLPDYSHKQHVVVDVFVVIFGQDNETLTKQIYE